MDQIVIDGVSLTPLKRIYHPKGDIYHALKCTEKSYHGFGEAYFSTIKRGDVKGWKKHVKMTLNIVVPVGQIAFVLHDDRKESSTCSMFNTIVISHDNYLRLTVPPLVWMGFMGVGHGLNLLLNIADIEHDPQEAVNTSLGQFQFDWDSIVGSK